MHTNVFSETCVTPGDVSASQSDCTNDTYCDLACQSCLPSTPAADLAWYYDDLANPMKIHLCAFACQSATAAGDGANLSVVAGCSDTVVIVD